MDYIYVITAGVGFVGIVIYYYLTKNYGYWKKAGVPYLTGSLPGLGNVYPMMFMQKNMLDMYREFYEKMPGRSMVGFYNFTNPALLIRDPELVKTVLHTNFSSFNSNGMAIDPKLDPILSRNPFVLEGEKWKASRQQLSSAFTSGKLKYMYESIGVVCEKLVSYLDNKIAKGHGEFEVELKELYSRYTAEVVASAAFGAEGNSFKDEGDGTFTEIGKIIFEPSVTKGLKQLAVMFVPVVGKIFRMSMVPPEVDKVFTRLAKDMMKYRTDQNIQRNDFLQLMISLKKSGATDHVYGGDFSDQTIVSHAASFFFDGYETSSIVLSFVFYQLANHPEIQKRVREEVLTVLEEHNDITYEAVTQMTYMEQVLHESMRIIPPGGAMFKVCTKEIELKGSDGIICRVTPGTPVMIPVGGLHSDPEYWPDPEKFDPDRFTEENKQKRPKFTYLPFGEGPRACVGMRMATLQIKAAIATTLKRYSIKPSPKTKTPVQLDPRYFLSSALGGLWVKLEHL